MSNRLWDLVIGVWDLTGIWFPGHWGLIKSVSPPELSRTPPTPAGPERFDQKIDISVRQNTMPKHHRGVAQFG